MNKANAHPGDGQTLRVPMMRARFILAGLIALVGCDTDFMMAGPVETCVESGVQCVLPDGPLGVCEQVQCGADRPQ